MADPYADEGARPAFIALKLILNARSDGAHHLLGIEGIVAGGRFERVDERGLYKSRTGDTEAKVVNNIREMENV